MIIKCLLAYILKAGVARVQTWIFRRGIVWERENYQSQSLKAKLLQCVTNKGQGVLKSLAEKPKILAKHVFGFF